MLLFLPTERHKNINNNHHFKRPPTTLPRRVPPPSLCSRCWKPTESACCEIIEKSKKEGHKIGPKGGGHRRSVLHAYAVCSPMQWMQYFRTHYTAHVRKEKGVLCLSITPVAPSWKCSPFETTWVNISCSVVTQWFIRVSQQERERTKMLLVAVLRSC